MLQWDSLLQRCSLERKCPLQGPVCSQLATRSVKTLGLVARECSDSATYECPDAVVCRVYSAPHCTSKNGGSAFCETHLAAGSGTPCVDAPLYI
eukprot:4708077-Amphidinium_carterae.1